MSAHRIPTVASLLSLVLPVWLSAATAIHLPRLARKAAAARAVEATLNVTNNNPQPVSVVVITADGEQYPLGEVSRQRTQVFDLPSDLVGSPNVTILADPLDHFTGFKSEPLTLEPGQTADLVVERAATHSHLTVD